jgi:methionyl aminopeptidase
MSNQSQGTIYNQEQISSARKSGKILSSVLDMLEEQFKVGISDTTLNKLAHEMTLDLGATPAFLGYNGFPQALCISFNNQIVHGYAKDRIVKEGDLVGLDYGVKFEGMITDSARTLPAGPVSKDVLRLIDATKGALDNVISMIKPGVTTGDIGFNINQVLRKYKTKCIYDLCGHGVGISPHEAPIIPNYGQANRGPKMRAGMIIAIEPIASLGTHHMIVEADKWTCSTIDGSYSSQFEHTLLITNDSVEVLTA